MNALHWIKLRFELSRHGDSANVRPMEGLRGLAVFLVFLTHFVTLLSPQIENQALLASFAALIHSVGNSGVDLFFVLSGYLIYGSTISRHQEFIAFMRRRIVRIYPAFIVVFAIYLGLSYFVPEYSRIPSGMSAGSIYVLQNFLLLPGLFPITPIMTVAWSLSYEMFYYLALPLTVAALRLRQQSAAVRVVFFLALGTTLAAYCAMYGGPIRLLMFIAGIMLYEAMRTKTAALNSWIGLLALMAGLFASLLPVYGAGGAVAVVLIQATAFFAVCLTCFIRPGEWLGWCLSWTPLRWLGNMSYSYYLLHGLALKVAYTALFSSWSAVERGFAFFFGMIPVMFAITLVPSAILFLLVERPFSLDVASRAKRSEQGSPVASVT